MESFTALCAGFEGHLQFFHGLEEDFKNKKLVSQKYINKNGEMIVKSGK